MSLKSTGRYDLVSIDVAKQLKTIGVPQISNYWYALKTKSGYYYYHRSFRRANEFMRKVNSENESAASYLIMIGSN